MSGKDPAQMRLELARVHLIQKNYDKAAQYLEEAVQHSHSDPVLLARLGEAYLGGRKIEEAEAIFKRLLEINPGDDDARAQMGRVFLLQERFEDAFRELQPSLERLIARREGDRAAALLQQRAVRHVLRERVLERVLDLGIEARLVEVLGGLEVREPLAEILLRRLGDGPEQRQRHLRADDGR